MKGEPVVRAMSLTRQKRLDRAQMRVLFSVPFFAPGVAKMPVVWDSAVPTACTDGKEIRWNPEWFDGLPDNTLPTVLCHEVAHCMLGHLWRGPVERDAQKWDTWNQATDHAVNLMLKDFSQVVMGQSLADPFPFPDPQDAYCADPKFKGMAEEVIYAALSSSKPPQQGGNGQGKAGQQGGSAGSTQPNGGPKPGKGKSAPTNARQKMPVFGEMSQPSQDQAARQGQKELKNDWEGTLVQAVQMSAGRGDLPAGLERMVDKVVNPGIPWQQILRSWLREQCADDWNFLEPAMEYSGCEFIMPSLKSEKMGPVVFATDTSGSINNELLAKFQTEKQSCLDEMRPSKLVDIYCDSAIHKVAEYGLGERIDKHAPGGGGTDFRPVWEHLGKMPERPKCVVYLTDLDGTFPADDGGIPTIWVVYGTKRKASFGETVYADDQ